MTEYLQILTSTSLEILRTEANTNQDIFFLEDGSLKSLNELSRECSLEFQSSPFTLPAEFELLQPEGSDWSVNHDRLNSESLYNNLGGMTPSSATNETLWVTLGFSQLAGYANARRPVQMSQSHSLVDAKTTSKDHTNEILGKRFAVRSRDRWREHPIARLWWVYEFASRFSELGPKVALDVLYLNSDLQGSLLGRPSLASSPQLTEAILKICHEKFIVERVLDFKRESFRTWMKNIDLRAGKAMIHAMPSDAVESLARMEFERAF